MTAPRLIRSLYFQVLVAIAIGITLGYFAPQTGTAMRPLGDGFIKLIRMIISPIIFTTVVLGIAGSEQLKKVGKTGGLALIYFEVVSTLSLLLGMLVVNLVRPGAGMNADVRTLDTSAVAAYAGAAKTQSVKDFVLNIIPATFFDAFAKGEILQVLLLAILFGIALQKLGSRFSLVLEFIDKVSHVLFEIVGLIMRLAPIGAFGAMAFTVGSYGLASLLSLSKLMGTFYLTCILFIFGVLGAIARVHGFNIFKYVYYIREEILIVLGTSSSEAALPRLMARIEALGASRSTVGLVIPTGYSFNLDGTSIYLSMAAIFIAQATNSPLTVFQQLTLLIVLMLTSKGAAGVTGSGFIVLAATLSATGTLPVGGLALILGIDRFMSEARSITNLIGNGVAALVVAKWTDELDTAALQRGLENRKQPAEAAPAAVS